PRRRFAEKAKNSPGRKQEGSEIGREQNRFSFSRRSLAPALIGVQGRNHDNGSTTETVAPASRRPRSVLGEGKTFRITPLLSSPISSVTIRSPSSCVLSLGRVWTILRS